jgi:hypothetical protein
MVRCTAASAHQTMGLGIIVEIRGACHHQDCKLPAYRAGCLNADRGLQSLQRLFFSDF